MRIGISLDLLDLDHLSPSIGAARGADAVRQLEVATTRTGRDCDRLGLVVSAPLSLALFRCPLLWYSHLSSFTLTSTRAGEPIYHRSHRSEEHTSELQSR